MSHLPSPGEVVAHNIAPLHPRRSSAVQRPKRGPVKHLFWVKTMEIAEQMGVDMRSLCGVWDQPDRPREPDHERDTVLVVGGLVFPEVRDCKRCVRSLAAFHRARG